MKYTYVFGPVFSGRLGRSLGLDLLGGNICSHDCLYCEAGRTHKLTCTRAPYVPARDLLNELSAWKEDAQNDPAGLDYVTLGGSGEPCLNSELDLIIKGVKSLFPDTPVAVLTNSTHLHHADVRKALQGADAILPSLDSLVPEEFTRLNKPHPSLNVKTMAQSLLTFKKDYSGQIFLEILLAKNINDTEQNLERLVKFVRKLQPQRVDVTTLSRPGAYDEAKAVSKETLEHWRDSLTCEIKPDTNKEKRTGFERDAVAMGAGFRHKDLLEGARGVSESLSETLFQSLRRRPQTCEQLARALDAPEHSVLQALQTLIDQARIEQDTNNAPRFYRLARKK